MITRVESVNAKLLYPNSLKKQEKSSNNVSNTINYSSKLLGIPRSYISFRGKTFSDLNLTEDAKALAERAENIAKENKHSEITPAHVIAAGIEETEDALKMFPKEVLDSGAIESISTLNKIVNSAANENMIATKENRDYFSTALSELKEANMEQLKHFQQNLDNTDNKRPELTDNFYDFLTKSTQEAPIINSLMLLGSAMDNYSLKDKIPYPSDFLKDFIALTYYKKDDEIQDNYMKEYTTRAIDVWNKLALGSNLFVTCEDGKEAERLAASIVNTINANKHGDVNSKNTFVYNFSETIKPNFLQGEINKINETIPDKQKLFILNLDYLLANSMNNPDKDVIADEIIDLPLSLDDKSRLILFQNEKTNSAFLLDPEVKKTYNNFITYSIPPIRTYEAIEILKKNKELVKDVKTPFTKDAMEKAVYYSDKLDGIMPDKSIDLMKRIASYYGRDKKKITTKEVDEFAQVGYELFKDKSEGTKIVYDTGKNLASLYGKDTTKKDLIALVQQIKRGNIGTKGIVITSKDEEAGSGRKYTIEALAGEAKVPFIEIDTTDFARSEDVDILGQAISPRNSMSKVFAEAKKAAVQNPYRTAIVYVNNFEEFAFSSPYLPGYKQAMAQLEKEMEKAEQEKLNILVVGSTYEEYAEYIPVAVRNFNQSISVDSPAFNNKSRKDIIENRIKEKSLPLAYRTKAEKEELIDKITKLTQYMSFVQIKTMIDKTEQIMLERNKKRASIGDFIESYLQLETGRTSHPETPEYNKQVTTSHECGHATNLEVMSDLLKRKGKPWHQFTNVNFITLDPRGDFLGAVFEGRSDNQSYPFEALFTDLVCAYGGHSCEKLFFNMDGSSGISQDLAQASAAAKRGIEYFGFGFNTGKISNAAKIASGKYNESVFKDMEVFLTNAQIASDLITECYRGFNEWFTSKYSKLIGSDDCMIDGDTFRKALAHWKKTATKSQKQEIEIMDDMILDIIKSTKNGKIYSQVKRVL